MMIQKWQTIEIKKLHVNGLTLFPFILIKTKELRKDGIFMNHEQIHLRQQLELLIILFYVFYLLNYIFNRFRYKDHDMAYRNICFERESYTHEKNLQYLKTRKLFSSAKYIKSK